MAAPSTRIQNLIIAILTVVAVSSSIFAVWSARQLHPSLVVNEGATTNPVVSNTTNASTTNVDDRPEVTEPTAEEAETTIVSKAGGRSTSDPSVAAWVNAWSSDSDLLIIGDGLSNLPSQWVQLWARQVGSDRPVRLHHWGESLDLSFNDAHVLSEGSGEPLTVWSASRAGSTVAQAAEHYHRFVEASTKPDAVLISLGLSSANEDVASGLDSLVREIDQDVPVLIAIGPTGLYASGVGDAFLAWAQAHSNRVSVVDVRPTASLYPTAEQWAKAFQRALDDG